MNKKLLTTVLATAAVASVIPCSEAMADTSVTASSQTVRVASHVSEKTVETDFGTVKVKYYMGETDYSSELDSPKGYNAVRTGSESDTNNDGVHKSYDYYALAAIPGQEVTFRATQNNRGVLRLSIGGTEIFNSPRSENTYSGVSVTFTMPRTKNLKMERYYGGSHKSDSRTTETYTLIPLTNIDAGNPTSEPAVTVQQVLMNYSCKNETTINDLQTLANNCIDTSKFNVTLSQTKKTAATESNEGSLEGTILVTSKSDSSKKTQTNFKLVIPKSGQSLDTIYSTLNKFVNGYEASNNSKSTDFTSAATITNNNLSVNMSNFAVTRASETTKGNVKGTLIIKDSSTGATKTIVVNKTIDYLKQSCSTVAQLYKDKIKDYVATSNTTAQDILDLVNVSNSDISVTSDSFKNYYTDDSNGKLTMNINIKDKSTNESMTVPVTCKVQVCSEELSTALSKVQGFLSNYKATNDTSITQLLAKINAEISNSNISLLNSEDNPVKKVVATEDAAGSISGSLVLCDSEEHEVKVNVSLGIDKLNQTLSSAENNVKSYIETLKGNNDLTESDILMAVQNLLEENITAEIKDYSLVEATEDAPGSITGTVILSDGNQTKEIPINLEIDLQAQDLSNVINRINSKLTGMYLTNDDTESTLESALQDCITGANGSQIKIKVRAKDFNKTEATEDAPGNVTGDITVYDNSMNIEYVPYNIQIKQLAQSLDNAKDKVNSILQDYNPNNESTKEELESALQDCLTGADGSNISVSVTDFDKTDSTIKEPGALNIKVTVSDGSNSEEIEKQYEIAKNTQTPEEAKEILEVSLNNSSLHVTNDTTEEQLKEMIKEIVADNIDVSIDSFNKILATNTEAGSINSVVTFTDENGLTCSTELNLSISKLTQTIDEAKDTVDKALENIKVDNNTTKEDIENQLKEQLGNNIDVEIKDFNKTEATEDAPGSITGTIVITDKNTGEKTEIKLDEVIEQLKKTQTIEQAKDTVDKTLPTIKVDNNTTKEDIESQLKEQLAENIKAEVNDFNKILATDKTDGKITGTVVVTNTDTNEKVEISLDIPILKNEIYASSGSGSSGGGGGSSSSSSNNSNSTSHHNNKTESEELDLENQINNETLAANSDWKMEYGRWRHKTNGNYDTGWKLISGSWYYFDSDGYMCTGWIKDNGKWYYLSEKAGDTLGAMQTGWIYLNGTWYYLNHDGSMATGWLKDTSDGNWYYLNSDGSMVTGWNNINGSWYYMNTISDGTRGKMESGWHKIGNLWYYLNGNGVMQTGWNKINDTWYYFDIEGAMQTGWQQINGTWYYFDSNGAMQSDTIVDGCKLEKSGALVA